MDPTQFDAPNRLTHLGLIRQEKLSRVRALSGRARDLGQRRQRTLARIARLEAEMTGRATPAQQKEIDSLHTEVAALGDEKRRCEEHRDAAAEESAAAGRTHENALAFARQNNLTLPFDERDETLSVGGTGQLEGT